MNIDTKVETTIDQSSTFKQSLEIKILGECNHWQNNVSTSVIINGC